MRWVELLDGRFDDTPSAHSAAHHAEASSMRMLIPHGEPQIRSAGKEDSLDKDVNRE